jgi:hypothetical protein
MCWCPGWRLTIVWLLAIALAAVIYFVPMTLFIDNLSEVPQSAQPPNRTRQPGEGHRQRQMSLNGSGGRSVASLVTTR